MLRNMTKGTRETCVVALTLVLAGVAVMPAQAGDKEDIVGRWDHPYTDAAYIRFYADGTYKSVALLGSQVGKYRLLGDGVIELDVPGTFYGRNQGEIKYRLSGDTLELKLFGEWIKYKRAK
jgi:hypothetical protein